MPLKRFGIYDNNYDSLKGDIAAGCGYDVFWRYMTKG